MLCHRIAFKNVRISANLITNRISSRLAIREHDAIIAAVYRVPRVHFHLGGDEFRLSLVAPRVSGPLDWRHLKMLSNIKKTFRRYKKSQKAVVKYNSH